VLLFSLRNYRIVVSLGLEELSIVAFGVVVDTGAGPNLVRRSALAPDWLHQVVTSMEEEQVRLRDAKNARLRTSGTVTLWLQTGARIVSVAFLVVDVLWVPIFLRCTLIDDNALAILPQDRSILWTDGSVTTFLRGPLDDGDCSMGVSCILRFARKTRLPPSTATVVWVWTMWGGLGQVFGASRLFTMHGITIASGVHDIVPGLSSPVIVTNFGTREVVRRQRANVGYVELLTTGVVQVPHAEPHGASDVPDFTTSTTMEGVVRRCQARGVPLDRGGTRGRLFRHGADPRHQRGLGTQAKGAPHRVPHSPWPRSTCRKWTSQMPTRHCTPGSGACWASTRKCGRARRWAS